MVGTGVIIQNPEGTANGSSSPRSADRRGRRAWHRSGQTGTWCRVRRWKVARSVMPNSCSEVRSWSRSWASWSTLCASDAVVIGTRAFTSRRRRRVDG